MDKTTMKKAFWTFTGEETLKELNSRKEGLNESEVEARLEKFGANEIAEKRGLNRLQILIGQFKSPLIFILVIAGFVTLGIGDYVDAGVIFLAVFVNAGLGFYQENKAEKALEHLKTYLKDRVRIIRAGQEHEIDVREIVPGDIVHLISGERVPADARIIQAQDLQVDEAVLTGESLPAEKQEEPLPQATELGDRANMVFAGTQVVGGSGLAVIHATGPASQLGRIAELVASTEREKTPLQRSIEKLAWIITLGLGAFVSLVFVLGVMRGETFFDMFLVSVAMAVSSIPEALPISLTVILAVGVERLAHRKGVVRKLAAAETLGSTTVVLTDKTGTLTEANMRLLGIIPAEVLAKKEKAQNTESEEFSDYQRNIIKTGLINSDVVIENPNVAPRNWRLLGNPMERNMVSEAVQLGINLNDLRGEVRSFSVLPFNSRNKFSVSYVYGSDTFDMNGLGGKNFLSFLGAPDILLDKSDMPKGEKERVSKEIAKMAASGRRLLGVAVKQFGDARGLGDVEAEEVTGLTFLGVLAFYDPVRPEAIEATKKVTELGVHTVMVTGDLKGTALSIAKELGWDVTERNALSGKEIRGLSDEDLSNRLDEIRIFARVSPEDKVRIAQLYKKRGEIVAMTGDGVNDAPSLKAADIGVAVGSGTDVAKDIADLVLLDDNFETIVAAIEEGRRILSNIKKSTTYLMSDALNEVFLIGGALLVGLPLPLTALQILWVNFFSDSLPALTFAFDDQYDNSLDKASKSGDKASKSGNRLLTNDVKFLVLGIGTVISALLFVMYWFLLRAGYDYETVRTFIFVSFGVYTIFLAFPLRSLRKSIFSYNPFSNKWLNLSVLFGVVLMVLAVYVPFLQDILETQPLGSGWVAAVAGWLVLNIGAVEVTKFFFRKSSMYE